MVLPLPSAISPAFSELLRRRGFSARFERAEIALPGNMEIALPGNMEIALPGNMEIALPGNMEIALPGNAEIILRISRTFRIMKRDSFDFCETKSIPQIHFTTNGGKSHLFSVCSGFPFVSDFRSFRILTMP